MTYCPQKEKEKARSSKGGACFLREKKTVTFEHKLIDKGSLARGEEWKRDYTIYRGR